MKDHKDELKDATALALRQVALPDICRVEDLADHIGLSRSAIRRALREGRLPGRRVGRRWLVARSVLLQWLSERGDGDRPPPSRPNPALLRLLRERKAPR